MNLTFTGNDLYKVFSLAASIVPSSAMKQILHGIKMEVRDGVVELTATDLEVLVKCLPMVKACTEKNGGVVIPAARVNSILRDWAGNDEVLLSIEGNTCVLKSKCGYCKVLGEDYKQYPEIHPTDVKELIEVDGEIISDMVGRIVHAASTIKARSTLCGVFIKIEGEYIVMVAADGNRLSYIRRKVSQCKAIVSGIVTVKCLTFLQRFVSEFKGTLKLGIGESQIHFLGAKGEIISQLIDGQYPKYEDVIPKENDKKVIANKEELLSMVRMASFMTSEGCRMVNFLLNKDKLTLSSKTADVGEAELEMGVEYNGPEFKISFNPDYILDALKVSDSDTVTVEFGSGNNAALFRTGHDQLDVIMPVEMS